MIDHPPPITARIDVDGTLKMWPAPRRPESFWEERADAIVKAALSDHGNAELVEALLQAPPLPREPGDPIVELRAPRKKLTKGSRGFVAGAAIAAVGLAAAFAIVLRDRPISPEMPPAPIEARMNQPVEPPPPDQTPPAREAAVTPIPPPEAPPATAAATPIKTPSLKEAARPPAASTAIANNKPAPAPAAQGQEKEQPMVGPTKITPPNAMDGKEIADDSRIPADSEAMSPEIPQQPAQGSIAAALRSVMGGAKQCVAGANEASRASITFDSSGAVKSVAVTGWAAANGATGCVTSALKNAHVGRFWKPSFTVNVTLQP